ncbi:Hsp20/alpha crystallin family protein [Thermodesulfobacteriota bacterium]
MADNDTKALEAKEKEELTSAAEQTRPGFVFTPTVDIFETDKEITVLADMPGVIANNLDINLKENILTLSGDVDSPESQGETDIINEYRIGRYFREFTLSDLINQSKIDAELKDGVLRLKLPKAEKATPRKITVKAA